MKLSRPSMKRALHVVVAPIRLAQPLLWRDLPAAVVFVSDPECAARLPVDVLSRLYGLTPGEARVCQELVSGKSVNEIADLLEVTQDTVRKHVKQALSKTDTRRQAELVRLLLCSMIGVGTRAS